MSLDKKGIYEKIASKEITVEEGLRLLKGLEESSSPQAEAGSLKETIVNELKEMFAGIIKRSPREIKVEAGFYDQGLDSNDLLQFVKELEDRLGEELYPTLLFEYTNISALADYLEEEYKDRYRSESVKASLPQQNVQQDLSRGETIVDSLKVMFSQIIGKPVGQVDIKAGFYDQGLDSNDLLQFVKELEGKIGEELYPTLLFEYTNISTLAEYLEEEYKGKYPLKSVATGKAEPLKKVKAASPPLKKITEMPKLEPTIQEGDVAIIGLSGRYPMADDIYQFWENLKAGRDCITEIPEERWDYERYFNPDKNNKGTTYSKWGGFINDVDKFDPLFFNISPREATIMDPQERLFLEEAWKTIEDAGYTRESLGTDRVGVFAGVMYGDYQLFGTDDSLKEKPNAFYASIANRVSYIFNFQGPSIALDTMCSSSLTTIHLAYQSIRSGECELAIAGGVNVTIHPNKYLRLAQQNFVSSDGRCRSFGKGGDGYVPGEGVGAILLKPLKSAIADNDHIYAVIKGSALNHGGKASGITVPNPNAQAELVKMALEHAQIDPRTISYLEAHGTGTSLGDPIEITGLTKAFGRYTKDKEYCPIGSVKSNVGHLESAAGISGITKLLLQLKHKQLVPSIHSDELNPNINFKKSPFYVQHKLEEWKRPVVGNKEYPRRAGISGFGAGGSNAHIILEEYGGERVKTAQAEEYLIVLSAKSEQSLKEYCGNLLSFLDRNEQEGLTIGDIAYTLATGKEEMKFRLAFIAIDKMGLKRKLAGFVDESLERDELYVGRVKDDEVPEVATEQCLIDRKLAKVAELWCRGASVKWELLYDRQCYNRLSLPTYCFDRRSYWVNHSYERTSYFNYIKHTIELNSESFYLKDHVVINDNILPGAVYLEIAKASGELERNNKIRSLKGLTWYKPLLVSDTKAINIEFSGNKFEFFTENSKKNIHARGEISYRNLPKEEALDIEGLRLKMNSSLEKKKCYEYFAEIGLNYGPAFQVIEELHYNESAVLARLQLTSGLTEKNDNFYLHPSLMDGALHSIIGFSYNRRGALYLPYSIEEVNFYKPLPANCWVYITKGETQSEFQMNYDFKITNSKGEVLVSVNDFLVRKAESLKLSAAGSGAFEKLFYRDKWITKGLAKTKGEKRLPPGTLIFSHHDSPLYLEAKREVSGKMGLILVERGKSFKKKSSLHYVVNPAEEEDYRALFSELKQDDITPKALIHQWSEAKFSLKEKEIENQLEEGVYSLFLLTRELIKAKLKTVQLLYIYSSDKRGQPFYRAVGSFARTVRMENSRFYYKTLEVENTLPGTLLLDELMEKEDIEVIYRGKERQVKVISEFRLDNSLKKGEGLKDGGVYIITGGAGGLGLIFARFIASEVKAILILTGRSALDERKGKQIEELKKLGATVEYVSTDVTKKEDIKSLIDKTKSKYAKISGIIHSAGITRDSLISNKSMDDLKLVLSPKVKGTLYLDEVTKDEKLDLFVLFSSIAALGNNGQCDYSYANGFMDNFSSLREELRKEGKRTGSVLSINWPLWKDGGMQVDEATVKYLENTIGFRPLSTAVGLEAFKKGLSYGGSQFIVLEGNRDKLIKTLPIERAGTLEEFGFDSVKSSKEPEGLELGLVQLVSNLLKIEISQIDVESDLTDYGFDSVTLTELSNLINEQYDTHTTPTTFLEYSTVAKLAGYLKISVDKTLITGENKLASKGEREVGSARGIVETGGVTTIISELLEIDESEIEADADLADYGFDSVTFTELSNLINKKYNVDTTPTTFLEYSTAAKLTEYLKSSGVVFHEVQQKSISLGKGREIISDNIKAGAAGVTAIISELLEIDESEIEADADLADYGFDSVTFTELSNLINERYNVDTTPTTFLEYSTVTKLTEYLKSFGAVIDSQQKVRASSLDVEEIASGNIDAGGAGVTAIISQLLEIDESQIEADADLADYGFDSVTFTELSNLLNERYGVDTTPTTFLEFSTVAKLTQYLSANTGIQEKKNTVLKDYRPDNVEFIGIIPQGERGEEDDTKWLEIGDKELAYFNNRDFISALTKEYKRIRLLVKLTTGPRMEVVISGHGAPVLIIPGMGLTYESLYPLIKRIEQDYQVITFHSPGHGLSERIQKLSLSTISDVIKEVLDILGYSSPLHVIGSSAGGMIAQTFIHKYSTMGKSLTLLGTGYMAKDIKYSGATTIESRINEEFAYLIKKTGSKKIKNNQDRYREILISNTKIDSIMALSYQENILSNASTLDILSELKLPTYIISGKHDLTLGVGQSKVLRDKIKGAEYYEIKKGGHFIFVTHIKKVAKLIINFINKNR